MSCCSPTCGLNFDPDRGVRFRCQRLNRCTRVTLGKPGEISCLATDGAARFARVGSTFLGEILRPDAIEIIDL
jgi:hypothetical protein